MSGQGDVTRMLHAGNAGSSETLAAVMGMLHGELRPIASSQLARERDGNTLETSGFVSETWLRLLGVEPITWHDPQHLLAMATRMVRRAARAWLNRELTA